MKRVLSSWRVAECVTRTTSRVLPEFSSDFLLALSSSTICCGALLSCLGCSGDFPGNNVHGMKRWCMSSQDPSVLLTKSATVSAIFEQKSSAEDQFFWNLTRSAPRRRESNKRAISTGERCHVYHHTIDPIKFQNVYCSYQAGHALERNGRLLRFGKNSRFY